MKMPIMAILACGIALGAVLTVAADNGSTPDKSELDALRKQVQVLEVRIGVLEKLLEERPRESDATVRPPSLHGRLVPENWSRREFNGMPYYVIPLGHDPNQALLPRK